jgi:opacity protein-like surface antigen
MKLSINALALAVTLGVPAALAQAPAGERTGQWDVALQLRYQEYDTIEFRRDLELDPESGWAFGFGFGYNFTPHLNLAFEITGDDADYHGSALTDAASPQPVAFDGSLETSTGQLNLTWHFLPGAITPYVVGGIGWTYLDSNIIRGTPDLGCWHHPWWGYVCGAFYDTYDDTVLSYNFGAGVRWDINRAWFLRGSVGRQWLDIDDTSSEPHIDLARIEVGMKY